jgi:hypothetical protein
MTKRAAAIVFALITLGAAGAGADPRGDSLAGVTRCQGIADDRTFLNCVYGAMQPLRTELGLPPAPASQVGLVPPVSLVPAPAPRPGPVARHDQGMLGGLFGSGKAEAPSQRMAAFSFDRNGMFTVSLANGEVWRQVSGDISMAHWHGEPSNYVVTIRGGALGSFNLKVNGDPTAFKVVRVR